MKKFIYLATLLVSVLNSSLLLAQTSVSLFDQLSSTEKIQLSLKTDVSALIINKNTVDYQEGILSSADGKSYTIGVRPRGKFRRRISDIPPLKLKIKKKLLAAEGLIDSLNELKIVLPTTLDKSGDELVIREYLAYRMFEQVSPYATRARLIDLILVNTNAQDPGKYTVKAILLEDEEETAARLGGVMVERFGMTTDSLDSDQTALMIMFQYMIGNTDWEIPFQRNIRFLKTADGKYFPIPFDFDFAGLVNAPYATPMAGLGIRSVRERHLMANGMADTMLKTAGQKIAEHQQSIRAMCNTGLLPEKNSRNLNEYMDQFFTEIHRDQSGR